MIMKVIPDAVERRTPILMSGSATVSDAAKQMQEERIGAVLISQNDELEGIFTERDVSYRVIGCDKNPKTTLLRDVMTTNLKTVQQGDTVISVLDKMMRFHIRRMPIMDQGRLVGLVGIREILASTIQQISRELEKLNIELPDDCRIASGLVPKRPLASLPPNASAYHAAGLMKEHHIGSILVMQSGELKGIFTERDVSFRVVSQGLSPDQTSLSEVMTTDLVTVSPGESCNEVAKRMMDGHFRHLPIIEDGGPIGILSIRDLFDYLRNRLEHEFQEAMIKRTKDMIEAQ